MTNNQNKPEWENDFRKMLKVFYTEELCNKMDFEHIESFISSLLSKVIDEIELEQGEFHTSPIDERFDAGYDKAVSDYNEIKKLTKQKYGIE